MTSINRPFRNGRALLGFLLKGEVDAIFKQQPVELGNEKTDPARAWRASCDAVRRLHATSMDAHVDVLDEAQIPILRTIRSRRTFVRHYDAIDDYCFAMVPISALLAPQWLADLDYVNELASQISQSANLEDLIRFTMAEGTITEPIITGSQVIFTSLRPDIYADQIPTVREVEPGEFDIVVRASGRPNYVSVAALAGRLLLLNGVHHVCSLALQGYESVPCVLRTVGRVEETGLNLQTSLFRADLFFGQRPAQVLDFLNDRVAVPLKIRSMYHITRIAIGVEPIRIPAIANANATHERNAREAVPGAAGLASAAVQGTASAI